MFKEMFHGFYNIWDTKLVSNTFDNLLFCDMRNTVKMVHKERKNSVEGQRIMPSSLGIHPSVCQKEKSACVPEVCKNTISISQGCMHARKIKTQWRHGCEERVRPFWQPT